MPSHIYSEELRKHYRTQAPGYFAQLSHNIGDMERIASLAGGATLLAVGVALGIQKKSPLGFALAAVGGALAYRGATGHCDVYERLGVQEQDADRTSNPLSREMVMEEKVEINKPPQEVYDYWRKLENLPQIMRHLKRVTKLNGVSSEWVAEGPLGREVKWRARITDDRPGELLSWMSTGDSDVDTSGTVRFRALGEDDEQTLLQVRITFRPPAGVAGLLVSRMLGTDPAAELREDLARFRMTMDTGQTPPNPDEVPGE